MNKKQKTRGKRIRLASRGLFFEALEARQLLAAGTVTIAATFTYQQIPSTAQQNASGVFSGGQFAPFFIREAEVEIFDVPDNGAPVELTPTDATTGTLGTDPAGNSVVFTSDQGAIQVNVSGAWLQDGQSIELVVVAQSNTSLTWAAYNVQAQSGTVYTGPTITVAASNAVATRGGVYDLGVDAVTVAALPEENAAFAIFDAITTASQASAALSLPSAVSSVDAVYPAPDGRRTSWVGDDDTMYVEQTQAYSAGVVYHEYGHYVADAEFFGNENPTGGYHDAGLNLRYTSPKDGAPAYGKALGDTYAFEEGFASFYSLYVQQEQNASALGIYGIGNNVLNVLTYDDDADTVTVARTYDFINHQKTTGYGSGQQTTNIAVGEDDEASAAGILLGLLNGYSAPGTGQTIKLAINDIESLVMGSIQGTNVTWGARDLDDLWDKIDDPAAFTYSQIAAAGALFQKYGVSVVPTGFAQGVQFLPGGPPPTFSWAVPQAVNAHAGAQTNALMDGFTIIFLDSNSNPITINGVTDQGFAGTTAAAVTDANGNPVPGAFVGGQAIKPLPGKALDDQTQTISWQPTPQQWSSIASANPAYWVVVSRDSVAYFPFPLAAPPELSYPDTGDYWSAPQSISIAPRPAVTAVSTAGAGSSGSGYAEITIPYKLGQQLTVNYSIYTQTLYWNSTSNGLIGPGTLSERESGSVTIAAGDEEASVTLPGTYGDDVDPDVATLITVSLPGETVPDAADVLGDNQSNNLGPQVWPIVAGSNPSPVSITAVSSSTTYGGSPGEFELTRSGSLSMPLLIAPAAIGDATFYSANELYNSLPWWGEMPLYFPPETETIYVQATPTAGSTWESGDVQAQIVDSNMLSLQFPSASMTINVPTVPTVTISGGGSISEDWDSTDLTITRTGPRTRDLTVNLFAASTDSEGQDYFTLPNYVVIPAGSSSVQLPLVAIDRGLTTGSWEADITLEPTANEDAGDYSVGSASVASVTIDDDDEPDDGGSGQLAMGQFADPDFDAVDVSAVGWQYAPAGSPWTFSGHAGVSASGSAITAGNPSPPEGSQVGFVEETGSVSENISLAAGSYTISFSAAQCANYNQGDQTLEVLVDGTPVGGNLTPIGTNYATYSSPSFSAAAGTHTITIEGLDPSDGDSTALLDEVSIQLVTANQVADPDFSAVSVGTGGWQYAPSGSPWTFVATGGVSGNGSAITAGNAGAPQGSQVAFIQGTGSISQALNLLAGSSAGTYTLEFVAAQRENYNHGGQTLEVLVDGAVEGTVAPAGSNYALYAITFAASDGPHTITIAGTNPYGGDNTALVDDVSLETSIPDELADPDFGTVSLAAGNWQYGASGSPWTFIGTAGISASGSAITAGNPNPSQGSEVAFVQGTGSISQAVSLAAGGYTISFSAAQRGDYNQGGQTLEVLVDGMVAGTFTPTGTSYASYSTSAFAAAAGAHTITIVGLDPLGGDNTALVDNVSVQPLPSQLVDPDFGAVILSAGGWQYGASGSPWTFTGTAGISASGSAITAGNASPPAGSQVAFVQGNGSISQDVNLAAGTYTISFSATQRENYNQGGQALQVLVDGMDVGSGITPANASYTGYTSISFTVTTGMHLITIQGLNPQGGDNTALIDQVMINLA